MPRFPGHLRGSEPLIEPGLFLLLDEYNDYQPFAQDCLRSKEALRRIQEASGPFSSEGIVRSHKLIEALAQRWNLDRVPQVRDLGYTGLTEAVKRTGERVGRQTCGPFKPLSISLVGFVRDEPQVVFGERQWTWSLSGYGSLGQLRRRIMRDLYIARPADLPAEIAAQLSALPAAAERLGWELGDMASGLLKHVGWLFLRLCPQPDRPLGYARIADYEDQQGRIGDERVIRRAVTQLAGRMGIELPKLRTGAPSLRDRRPSER